MLAMCVLLHFNVRPVILW